jgi:hypothetical protein
MTLRNNNCFIFATGFWLSVAMCNIGVAEEAKLQQGQSQDGGVNVAWTFTQTPDAAESGLGIVDVKISDIVSKVALNYNDGRIMGWLQKDRGALSDQEKTCAESVSTLSSQGVGQKADIDINEYRLVTLNSDGTIAFINPFVGISNAKLESIIDLKAKPIDWLHVKSRMEMWVLLAEPPRLVSINLNSRKISNDISLPENAAGQAMSFDPQSQKIYVAMPSMKKLGVVDITAASPTLQLTENANVSSVIITEGSAPRQQQVLLVNSENHLSWLGNSEKIGTFDAPPIAAIYSEAASSVILALRNGKLVSFLQNGESHEIKLSHSISAMQLFDDGRRAFVVGHGYASVVDLATKSVTITASTPIDAENIIFTRNFAYALGAVSGHAAMFAIDDLKRGRNQALDVMISSAAAAVNAENGTRAGRAVASPEGTGVLVASAQDGMIYQYSEGMMAPVGSFSNYRRAALGLAIVDYSLQNIEPGHYRTTVRFTNSGKYKLLLGGIGPRFSSCGSIVVQANPKLTEQPPASFHAQLISSAAVKGTDSKVQKIRVHIVEQSPDGKKIKMAGLSDLTLLVFDKQSGWQRRSAFHEVEKGDYEATFNVPRSARYELLTSSSIANLSFVEGRLGEVPLGFEP